MFRGRARAGRRADLRWTYGTASILSVVSGATAGVTILSSGNVSSTLMRARGEVLFKLDAGATAGETQRITAGMLLVPGGTGTTVTSSPETDGDAPYFWFQPAILTSESGDETEPSKFARVVIDTKAMRIIRPDQEIQFVMENISVVGTSNVHTYAAVRFLLAD